MSSVTVNGVSLDEYLYEEQKKEHRLDALKDHDTASRMPCRRSTYFLNNRIRCEQKYDTKPGPVKFITPPVPTGWGREIAMPQAATVSEKSHAKDIVTFFLKNPYEWFPTREILEKTQGKTMNTTSAVVSRLYQFWEPKKLMERRRSGTGPGFHYRFTANVDEKNIPDEADLQIRDFNDWTNEQLRIARTNKAGKKDQEPQPETEAKPQTQPEMAPLEPESFIKDLVENGTNLKVSIKVEGAIRVLFGFQKEG